MPRQRRSLKEGAAFRGLQQEGEKKLPTFGLIAYYILSAAVISLKSGAEELASDFGPAVWPQSLNPRRHPKCKQRTLKNELFRKLN